MLWINKRIPTKGFIAMALFPFIFVRDDLRHKFNKSVETHERIHFEQQKELGLILFIVWYILEWFIKLFSATGSAYRNLSFEREAKANQKDNNYIKSRKRYSFIKYLIK